MRPILRVMATPADETPAQRAVRKAEEEEARLVSEQIDKEIKRDRRSQPPVKVVLMGQGSSKSVFISFIYSIRVFVFSFRRH